MRPTVLTMSSPLYYIEAGGGDPVVLLHGLGADCRIWDPLRPVLSRSWRVFTPDLPGHGRSSLPHRAVELELFARGISRWLDGLGLGPVRLAGHSLGAAVAALLAIERPALVRSLVLINPLLLTDQRPPEAVLRSFQMFKIARLLGKPSVNATRRFLEQGLGVSSSMLTAEVVEHWRETIHTGRRTLTAIHRELRLPRSHLAARLQGVECPTVVLWGERDALFPGQAAATGVTEVIRQGTTEFAETGHLPMAERPEEFTNWLDARLFQDAKPKV